MDMIWILGPGSFRMRALFQTRNDLSLKSFTDIFGGGNFLNFSWTPCLGKFFLLRLESASSTRPLMLVNLMREK